LPSYFVFGRASGVLSDSIGAYKAILDASKQVEVGAAQQLGVPDGQRQLLQVCTSVFTVLKRSAGMRVGLLTSAVEGAGQGGGT